MMEMAGKKGMVMENVVGGGRKMKEKIDRWRRR